MGATAPSRRCARIPTWKCCVQKSASGGKLRGIKPFAVSVPYAACGVHIVWPVALETGAHGAVAPPCSGPRNGPPPVPSRTAATALSPYKSTTWLQAAAQSPTKGYCTAAVRAAAITVCPTNERSSNTPYTVQAPRHPPRVPEKSAQLGAAASLLTHKRAANPSEHVLGPSLCPRLAKQQSGLGKATSLPRCDSRSTHTL